MVFSALQVLSRAKRAGGKCETSAECVAPNVCSKWGWCQWTKIYGEDGPSQERKKECQVKKLGQKENFTQTFLRGIRFVGQGTMSEPIGSAAGNSCSLECQQFNFLYLHLLLHKIGL